MNPAKTVIVATFLIILTAMYILSCCFRAEAAASSDMILIKGGTFQMGSPTSEIDREKDEVLHSVRISGFYMARYEVTQAEYHELTGTNPSNFKGDMLPVENVTWYDAVRFCNAKSIKEGLAPAYAINGENVAWDKKADGYRLPTEAEWEYAARAGTTTPFSTGGNITTNQADYYGTYPYNKAPSGEYRSATVKVDSFGPNPWGLYNVHGNVWEWCWDWYGEYDGAAQTDPSGPPDGTYRVSRGGGWNDFGRNLRSAYRAASPPANAIFNTGFRLARNAQQ